MYPGNVTARACPPDALMRAPVRGASPNFPRLIEVHMEMSPETSTKRQERRAFLLLTVALFPVLSIAIVVSYGFAVWIWQMFNGPPGS